MFYSYKDIAIKLDNKEFFANSVQIDTAIQLSPVLKIGQDQTNEYITTQQHHGNIRLSYNLTGADILKTKIANDATISGNIGGLSFGSGYLQSYSLAITPNNVITVNAGIAIFEPIEGVFNNYTPTPQTKHSLLHGSNISYTIPEGYSYESPNSITSLTYNYSAQITPEYVIVNAADFNQYSRPHIVNIINKTINSEIVCDNYSGFVRYSGNPIAIQVNLNHPNLDTVPESILISGQLFSKNLNHTINNPVENTWQIIQNIIDLQPTITSIVPTTLTPNQSVYIYGTNLSNTTNIKINQTSLDKFNLISKPGLDVLYGPVPYNVLSGYITVETVGYSIKSDNKIKVNYPTITIDSFSPVIAKTGTQVIINGDNFYYIDEVYFGDGNTTGAFVIDGPTRIFATVPANAISGAIKVKSNKRYISGLSTTGFLPTPHISGINPITGYVGDTITITGKNLDGISRITVNDLNASFATISNSELSITIPSGNYFGPLELEAKNHHLTTTILTNTSVYPDISITGVSKYTLYAEGFDTVEISGKNLIPELLYTVGYDVNGEALYRVSFNGALGDDFRLTTNYIKLTGYVPFDAIDGAILIHGPDGSYQYGTGAYVNIKYKTMEIKELTPTRVFRGTPSGPSYLSYSLLGERLFEITGHRWTGISSTNAGSGFFIKHEDYGHHDIFGKKYNIFNYPLPEYIATGFYQITVFNSGTVAQGNNIEARVPSDSNVLILPQD